MSGTRRWIRLDVGWEDSWLEDLSGAAAGCWPRLLCWVKRDGVRGKCKRPRTETLARRWRVQPADVLELERAAQQDGALVMHNDHWTVVNWEEYQGDPTAAERKRRERDHTETECVTVTARDTEESHPVTDLLSRATPTGTPTPTETPEEQPRVRAEIAQPESVQVVEFDTDDGSGFIHPGQRIPASQVFRAWESQLPQKIAAIDRGKHMRMARKLADNHSAQELALAFLGIGQLFPHSDGQPWDLADLDRKFTKAVTKARDHPELRSRQREAELLNLLEAAG
jgi:hypothetical protein